MPNPRRSVRRFTRLVAALACLALVGAGVAAAATMHGKRSHANSGTFVLANAVKIDTLDPEQNSVNESIWLDQNIYSRLLQPNATGTKLLPDLATSWKIANHGKTYTFHLRAAKFSDGTPVTAQDVVYSVNRARALKGGWGFLLDAVKKISAPNKRTVVFKLSEPHAPLLADLAMYAYSVIPASSKSQGAGFFNKPVSSGPYMVSSLNKDSELDLTVNPYWYGKKPSIKNIKVLIVPNDNTRVLMLQSGKVDAIENPPGNLVNQINKYPNLKADLFPSTRVDFIQLDEHFAPFKDRNVRMALNYGIDRNAIVKLAFSGHAVPAGSYMPYKMLYWDAKLKPYKYNLAKAKAYLKKSKYPHGFKCFLIEVSNDVSGNATAVVIKSELAKLGISVDIRDYELLTAYAKEDGGHSEMGQRYWTNDIVDPDEVTTFGVDSNGGANAFNSYWVNKKANALVEKARSELNPAKRRKIYYQIQRLMYQQSPFVVLDYSPYRYAQGKWVHGFHVNPLGAYNLALLKMTVSSH